MKKIYSLLLLGGLLLFGALPVFATTYTVAGDSKFFTSDWSATDTDNDMSELPDGSYAKTYENVTLESGYWYKFKVCQDHGWTTTYTMDNAGDNDHNSYFAVGDAGNYDIMIHMTSTHTISVRVCSSVVRLPNNKNAWSTEESKAWVLTRSDDYMTCSTTKSFSAGDNPTLKVWLQNGNTWLGGNSITRASNSATVSGSGSDITVTTDLSGEYIFTYTYSTGVLAVTYPEQPRTGLTEDNFGTICLSKAVPVSSISGAKFYNIYGKNATTNPTVLYLVEEVGNLVAGRPYIFQATADAITVTYTGDATSAGNHNGLYGTLSAMDATAMNALVGTVGKDIYLLSGNKVVKAGDNCTLAAGRAYIDMAQVEYQSVAPNAPSAIRMDLEENNATSIDAIEASEKAEKFIENGQIYILRGGIKYDTTGRVVK